MNWSELEVAMMFCLGGLISAAFGMLIVGNGLGLGWSLGLFSTWALGALLIFIMHKKSTKNGVAA